jgi:hypothetical protein
MQANRRSTMHGQQAANLLQFLVDAWATSAEVFLRREFGWNYIGAQAAAVVVLVPIFMMLWPGYDPRPLAWFLVAYLVMCVIARLQAGWRRMRGDANHSYYSGWPWLMGIFRRWSEVTVKRWVEPALVGILAALIGEHNAPLASYLVGSALCLFVSGHAREESVRKRVEAMKDAAIEQEIIAERFREMRDGWF